MMRGKSHMHAHVMAEKETTLGKSPLCIPCILFFHHVDKGTVKQTVLFRRADEIVPHQNLLLSYNRRRNCTDSTGPNSASANSTSCGCAWDGIELIHKRRDTKPSCIRNGQGPSILPSKMTALSFRREST